MQDQQEATQISDVDRTQGPTSNAMPNAWGSNPQPQPRQPSTSSNAAPVNPFANMFGGVNPFMQPQQQSNSASQAQNPMMMNPMFSQMFRQQQQQFSPPSNPREAYAGQLTQLVNMGFSNEQENINALNQARGNVQMAINILIGN